MQIMANLIQATFQKNRSSDQPEIYAQAKKEIKKATTPPKRSEKTLLHFPRLKEPIGFSFHTPRQHCLADLSKLRIIMAIIDPVALLIMYIVVERVTCSQARQGNDKGHHGNGGGDFTVSVRTNGNDEIAEMGRSVSKFISTCGK